MKTFASTLSPSSDHHVMYIDVLSDSDRPRTATVPHHAGLIHLSQM